MTFRAFVESLGVIPPQFIQPGKTHRCATIAHPRKKNGLIRLDEDERGGIVIDYSSGDNVSTWIRDGEQKERDLSADNAARSARIAAKREEERKGMERARKAYEVAHPILAAKHPYLERKRILSLGTCGLRADAEGNLIIPMYRDRKLISLQRISATGEKKFMAGAPSKLGCFWIERPRATVTILVEGFATGATCFEALTHSRVCVCFSASNLVAVAEHYDWSGLCVAAADYDRDTLENTGKNPGVEAGEKAAKAIGCGLAYPEFCDGTDWNDYFCERLARLEIEYAEREEFSPRKTPPHKLRSMALAPVGAQLMRAAKFVPQK